MMDFREYRATEDPPLALDSAEVLNLCVRRGEGSEDRTATVKEEPSANTEEIAHYTNSTSNSFPKYGDTAHSFHIPSHVQSFRPDLVPFGTAIHSPVSPGVIRPHPTVATPNLQYFPLQQPQQKQQQSFSILHQHLLQPNSPPPSVTSECHIGLSSPTPASHSPSSSDCSSIPGTPSTVPGATQTPTPLSVGYMLQNPTNFPIVPTAVPPLQSPVLNSSSKGSAGKSQRPFKAINISMSHNLLCSQDYLQFRQRMLEKIEKRIGKRNNRNNQMKRDTSPSQQPSSSDGNSHNIGSDSAVSGIGMVKDAAYRERRKKNNEAAKRSRDARREKEDELAIRTSFLEQENMILKCQVISLEKKLGIYPSPNTLRWQL